MKLKPQSDLPIPAQGIALIGCRAWGVHFARDFDQLMALKVVVDKDSKQLQRAVYYPLPSHLQPAVGHLGYGTGDCPEAEKASKEVVSLPYYALPPLTKSWASGKKT